MTSKSEHLAFFTEQQLRDLQSEIQQYMELHPPKGPVSTKNWSILRHIKRDIIGNLNSRARRAFYPFTQQDLTVLNLIIENPEIREALSLLPLESSI